MDNARLKTRIAGKVIDCNHPEYQGVWKQNWNQLRPERYPDLIVQVSSDHDVVEAVKYARENRLKVAVRGGGHAWCATSLRKGGMLIDLSQLNEVKIDPVAHVPHDPAPWPSAVLANGSYRELLGLHSRS